VEGPSKEETARYSRAIADIVEKKLGA